MIKLSELPEDVQTGIRCLPQCVSVNAQYCGHFEPWINSVLNSPVGHEQVSNRIRKLIEDHEPEYFSVINPVAFIPVPNSQFSPLPDPTPETKPYPLQDISYDVQISVFRGRVQQAIRALKYSGVLEQIGFPVENDDDLIFKLVSKRAGWPSNVSLRVSLKGRTIQELVHWLSTARDLYLDCLNQLQTA